MKAGQVYEVTQNLQFIINGKNCFKEGFYKLIGFSSKGHPVFEDKGEYFEAPQEDFNITKLNKSLNAKLTKGN